MLLNAPQCSSMLLNAPWCFSMLLDAPRYSMMLLDATWCYLMLLDTPLCSSMLVDACWCSSMFQYLMVISQYYTLFCSESLVSGSYSYHHRIHHEKSNDTKTLRLCHDLIRFKDSFNIYCLVFWCEGVSIETCYNSQIQHFT